MDLPLPSPAQHRLIPTGPSPHPPSLTSCSAVDYCVQTLVLSLIAPRPDLLVAPSPCFSYNTSLIGTYQLQFAPSKTTVPTRQSQRQSNHSLVAAPSPFIPHLLLLLIRAKPLDEPFLSFTSNSTLPFQLDALSLVYTHNDTSTAFSSGSIHIPVSVQSRTSHFTVSHAWLGWH